MNGTSRRLAAASRAVVTCALTSALMLRRHVTRPQAGARSRSSLRKVLIRDRAKHGKVPIVIVPFYYYF